MIIEYIREAKLGSEEELTLTFKISADIDILGTRSLNAFYFKGQPILIVLISLSVLKPQE